MALAAAALDECRLPGFHWAMRYLEGVNAVVSCCKQKYVSGIGEGGLSCLFEGPPREIERKAVSNVIIGLLCAELFHIASLFSHEERTRGSRLFTAEALRSASHVCERHNNSFHFPHQPRA